MSFPKRSAFLGLMAAATIAAPAQADLWWSQTIYGRSITTYTPPEFDATPAPTVFVIHDTITDGNRLADALPLYRVAKKNGHKIVYVGHTPEDEIARTGALPMTGFLDEAARMSVAESVTVENGIFLLGWGGTVPAIINYACTNPGLVRGVIAIGYNSADFPCPNPEALNALVIHQGLAEGATVGETTVSGTERLELALDELRADGAIVDSVALEGRWFSYPSLLAQFHDQTGETTLEEVVGFFVNVSMSER